MEGSQIGPYRIERQLGAGGMGVVYRALDTTLDRTVALKFVPPHLSADKNARARFIREAKAASALDHANICTIHHIGESDDGRLYIVMSYYEGQTLKYLLANGALPEEEALSIARQIAAGLYRAHQAGIVHRDIKPANLMVTAHGEVKILDFGIAKLEAVSDMTAEGSTLGTVAYMSPEQARGEDVGPPSDLWSLGVVLYQMLSGQQPFTGTYDQAVAYAILNEAPQDIRDVVSGVSDETADALNTLLAKEPGDRPADAADVYRLLGGTTGSMNSGSISGLGSSVLAASKAARAGLVRLVMRFAAAGIIGLAVVYAAMIGFGLPDWVFPLGVLLLLAGAPVTLLALQFDRKKARMNTAQRERLTGLASWWTLRRATLGGVFALAGLGLVSGGYMITRAMGIGPAATLITSGAFSSDDVVVVADFADQTAAGNLGPPIAEAMRIDLNQSGVVKLMDAATVRAVLERMDMPADTVLTPEIAGEVAIREGAKAVLIGGVSNLGSSYVINVRLVNASTGDEMIALRETAKTDDDVVDAVDRLSASFRERVGESLVTIRAGDPLSQVTTASLEALRLYTMADAANERDDAEGALGMLESAVKLDPEFAMAYRMMATVENNRWGSTSRMMEYASKAYEYRERLPRKERLYAAEAYYSWVERNSEKQMQLYEEMLDNDPNDVRAINNLSLHHRYRTGDYEKSLSYSRRLIEINPKRTQGYINTFYTLTRTGDWDEAQIMLDSIAAIQRDFAGLIWMRIALFAESTGDYASAIDSVRAVRRRQYNTEAGYFLALYETSMLQMLGRLSESEAALLRAVESSREIDNPEGMLLDIVWSNTYRYLADRDREGALARYAAAVDMVDPASLDSLSRVYAERAYMLATLGEFDEARAVLREQAANVPAGWLIEDPAVPGAEGMIALQEGRYDEAIGYYEKLMSSFRVPRIFEHELGLALLLAGRTDEAVERLESAARSTGWQGLAYDNGNGTLALRTLGDAYDAVGNTAEAIRAYEDFLSRWENADAVLQPQVAEVRRRVAELKSASETDRGDALPLGAGILETPVR